LETDSLNPGDFPERAEVSQCVSAKAARMRSANGQPLTEAEIEAAEEEALAWARKCSCS
jgi:hypothetical protein